MKLIIILTAEFGTFEFSPDEKKLLYIAEKKIPKNEPFYKRKAPEETKNNGGDTTKIVPKVIHIIIICGFRNKSFITLGRRISISAGLG